MSSAEPPLPWIMITAFPASSGLMPALVVFLMCMLSVFVKVELHRRCFSFALAPEFLKPGRELQLLAKVCLVFINSKPRLRGCHFKQYSTRFPEINGSKILPVQNRGRIQHTLTDLYSHFFLCCLIRCAERDVVY